MEVYNDKYTYLLVDSHNLNNDINKDYKIILYVNTNDISIELINLQKASKVFKDFAELEYRLSGIYFKFSNFSKGKKHLMNALTIDFEYHNEIKDLFPEVYKKQEVLDIINDFKNTSL